MKGFIKNVWGVALIGILSMPIAGNAQTYGPAQGVELSVNKATKWGDGMLVYFTLKNNLDYDIKNFIVNHNPGIPGNNDSRIIFDNGTSAYSNSMLHESTFYSVPSDAKRTGYVYVGSIPRKVKTIGLQLGARCDTGPVVTKTNPYGECLYVFDSIPVIDFPESNVEGAYCTNPNLRLNVNSVSRDGNDVIVDFILSNPTEEDLSYWLFGMEEPGAYDADGNAYATTYGVAGGKNTFKLMGDGGKVRLVATVKNVPKAVTEFQQIKVPFGNNDYLSRFACYFKNIPVSSDK